MTTPGATAHAEQGHTEGEGHGDVHVDAAKTRARASWTGNGDQEEKPRGERQRSGCSARQQRSGPRSGGGVARGGQALAKDCESARGQCLMSHSPQCRAGAIAFAIKINTLKWFEIIGQHE